MRETDDYKMVTVSLDLLVDKNHPLIAKKRMRRTETLTHTIQMLGGLQRGDNDDILGAAVNTRRVYRYWRMPNWVHPYLDRFKRNKLLDHLFPTITYGEWADAKEAERRKAAAAAEGHPEDSPAEPSEPVSISVA